MSIQPTRTPAQQTVHDLIQAWRETSGIPVPQHDSTEFGAPDGTIVVRKTAPADAATSVTPGPRHDSLGGRRD